MHKLKNMYKKMIVIIVIPTLLILLGIKTNSSQSVSATWWKFQSIDTMKYSRDVAREKLNDPSFNLIIEKQVEQIANTGATHVAIATPYDEEFYPILTRWVNAARRHGLKVWFRGNWSGWEKWFEYPKISRAEHIKKTKDFIEKHKDIFVDGDVFSPCPECENGGPGDPRKTGDTAGHRKFLVDEYKVTKETFRQIRKKVASNYASMNGDVAKLIMDRQTTAELDGVVTIDHYVATPEKLVSDIKFIAQVSGGKIVLGEFGAPIPDIHGRFTEKEQTEWLQDALVRLIQTDELLGISYWTNTGSSTELWKSDGTKRLAANTLRSFYKSEIISGKVEDETGSGVLGVYISIGDRRYFTDSDGKFVFPYFDHQKSAKVEAPGYFSQEIMVDSKQVRLIVLKKENEDIWFKIRKLVHNLLNLRR